MKRPLILVAAGLLISAIPVSAQDASCVKGTPDFEVVTEKNAFDSECYAVPADTAFKLTLRNEDRFAHNLSIYREQGGEALFVGPYVPGTKTQVYAVPALAGGSFYFRCDIHPQMDGTFNVGDVSKASASPKPDAGAKGRAPAGPAVGLEPVATGITAPVFITTPRDGTNRLFIIDQIGLIRVVEDDRLRDEPFLDVRDKLVKLNEGYDERGLLGLAFHPDFRNNGKFYVYLSTPLRDTAPDDWDHTSRLSEFRVSSADKNQADPGSERILMEIDEPQANHNGGHIAFGPDGMLYVPLGDGGQGNDVGVGHSPQGNAQDTSNVLGSILRIDVNQEPFGVPEDNPFVADDDNVRDEIWAYGFRNPYHISFDAETGDLYAADAGQDRFEEVSRVTKGGNHGWRIKEGTHCFDPKKPASPPSSCPSTGARGEQLIDPVIEYSREEILGSVVIGGYVYRGEAVPYLKGRYIFGDYSRNRIEPDGAIFVATPSEGDGLWPIRELRVRVSGAAPGASPSPQGAGTTQTQAGDLERFVLSFGEDEKRELYVGVIELGGPAGVTGAVYRLAAVPGENPPEEGPAAGDDGGNAWPWIALAAVVAALIVLGLMRLARGRSNA